MRIQDKKTKAGKIRTICHPDGYVILGGGPMTLREQHMMAATFRRDFDALDFTKINSEGEA